MNNAVNEYKWKLQQIKQKFNLGSTSDVRNVSIRLAVIRLLLRIVILTPDKKITRHINQTVA